MLYERLGIDSAAAGHDATKRFRREFGSRQTGSVTDLRRIRSTEWAGVQVDGFCIAEGPTMECTRLLTTGSEEEAKEETSR